MAEVKVLVEGKHGPREDGKLGIGSTVTLIKGEENILVDVGSFLDRERIIDELKKEGLTPDDINKVILTHLHLDHMVNVDLFNKSKVYCKLIGGTRYPGQFHVLSEGYLKRTELFDGTKISKDVSILLTPGHSMDMISVVVNTKGGKVVIAGDAISNEGLANLEKQPNTLTIVNTEKFNKSRKKILDIADYIIPGHGGMFKVQK